MIPTKAKTRKVNMAAIKSKNTKPEITVRKWLHKNGYRFRIHRKDLPGTPDIVLPKYRLVIFVHGCFWHGHRDCAEYRLPKKNTEYWVAKVERNSNRHLRATKTLTEQGWCNITIWECALKDEMELDKLGIYLNSFLPGAAK